MRIRHLLLAALSLAFLDPTALAQDLTATEVSADEAPARFTYSGLLTTSDGAVVADGPRALVFRGYASAEAARSGAAPAWQESHEAAVVGGRFLSVLGSQGDVPADVRYLTISVDGEAASAPVRLDRGATAEAGFAPGNTLQDSYDNGRVINVVPGSPMQIRGAAGDLGLTIRDITPVFISDQLMRFRLRSVQGGRTWEYRVYGTGATRAAGTFAITDATGGGSDGFIMEPGVGEDVMTLTGQTTQLGSPDNTADLRAYTTTAPGGPGTGMVNFRTYDYQGIGASSQWLTEDGVQHTSIAPDIDGTGGYFLIRGPSGDGFIVDGNNGSGTDVSIGLGAGSSYFDSGSSGTNAVALPVGAIDATEMLNEPGGASASADDFFWLDGTVQVVLARTITAPSDGFALVIGAGEAVMDHTNGTGSAAYLGVSADCDASPSLPASSQLATHIDGSAPSGYYQDVWGSTLMFPVSAGAATFCLVAERLYGGGVGISNRQLTVVFLPTAYGTVTSTLTGDEEDRGEGVVGGPQAPPVDLAAERAEADRFEAARIASELEHLQRRLADLEARRDDNGPEQR